MHLCSLSANQIWFIFSASPMWQGLGDVWEEGKGTFMLHSIENGGTQLPGAQFSLQGGKHRILTEFHEALQDVFDKNVV